MWSLRYMVELAFGLSRYCTSTFSITTNIVLSLFCNRVTVEWLERRSIDTPSSLQVDKDSSLCHANVCEAQYGC